MSHTPTTNQRKFLKKLSNDGSAGYKKNNDNNNKKKMSGMNIKTSHDDLSNTIGPSTTRHRSFGSKTPSHASGRQIVNDRLFKTGNPNVSLPTYTNTHTHIYIIFIQYLSLLSYNTNNNTIYIK